jgi:hypothetical protein
MTVSPEEGELVATDDPVLLGCEHGEPFLVEATLAWHSDNSGRPGRVRVRFVHSPARQRQRRPVGGLETANGLR